MAGNLKVPKRWSSGSKPLNAFTTRHLLLGEETISKSIQNSTSKQYEKKFEEWKIFITRVNDQQNTFNEFLHGLDSTEKSAIGLAFMSYLYYEKGVSPSTVANYMSAIRFHFQSMMEVMPWESDFANQKFMRGEP